MNLLVKLNKNSPSQKLRMKGSKRRKKETEEEKKKKGEEKGEAVDT